MPRSLGLCGAVIALALTLLLPASAGAVPAWQPEQLLPVGTSFTLASDQRGAQMDASGNALLAMRNPGTGYRWAYRPAGGPLSAMLTWPVASGLQQYSGLFAMNASGEAIGFNGGYWNAYRPAGSSLEFTNPQVTNTSPGGTLTDVAIAPSGEAFGFFTSGTPGVGRIAFRPAGAGSNFDMAEATTINPSGDDTGVTPIGITIDPDGRGAAVFRSTPSNTYFQVVRPTTDGDWLTPTQITGVPSIPSVIFDHASDGTAALAFVQTGVSGGQVVASVRAPGGTFPSLSNITTAPSGSQIGVQPLIAAVDGGKAVIAFNRTRNRAACGSPAGDNLDQGWDAWKFDSGLWSLFGTGPSQFPAASSLYGLDASGSTVGVVTSTKTFTGGGDCGYGTGGVGSLEVRLGGIGTLASPVDLLSSEFSPYSFFTVSSNGNALIGYWRDGSSQQSLRAFENPSGTGGNPGGGTGGGSGGGSNGGTDGGQQSPITAPAKITLQGTIIVRNKIVKLPMQCQSTYECYLVVTLFKVNPKDGAVVSAKPKKLAAVKAKIAPGAKSTLSLKLPKSVLGGLAKARGRKGTFFLQTQTTAGGSTLKVTQKRVFKLK